ncbi:MAG: hypothetical protein WCG21_08735 [Eubacteriales bacterium]
MLEKDGRIQKTGRKKSSLYSRSGRTGLEKILIAAVAVLLVAGVVVGTLLFTLWKSRPADNGTETTFSGDATQNDAITMPTGTQDNSLIEPTEKTTANTSNTSDTATPSETTAAAQTTAAAVTPAPITTVPATPAVPAISNPANMYSSYAHIKSFDPITGWASFDYFDMLVGDDAVQWLVENKGYTLAQAQAEVDNYGDGEFIEKNVNPQLRTVDMHTVPIKMMFHPDGTMAEAGAGVSMTYDEFKAFYAAYPDKVMNSFFYYITVEAGVITKVEQVYWA